MGDTILTGSRNPNTNQLWEIDLESPQPQEHANFMATTPTATPADLVAFAHAALFSPVPSTLQKALQKGYITSFPGLTSDTFAKYTPHSLATAKGHMDQQRQGIKSTKTEAAPLPLLLEPDNDDLFPEHEEQRDIKQQ
ncbi:hypothetical protein SEMRO_2814_G337700.1 [Seminavis robusta]|uniref:Uncharacterized protein n=1 Tax=Seminavis robusta TaxID=568900 RepID=A0A9N8HWV9_9STRA|nr:hypothetical protein SEMRO_2814_G337700.1 [Seminavis robusta]|eukprot:Sro2814_g337700.1 n/a (138) ;mRNA; r:6706-7119